MHGTDVVAYAVGGAIACEACVTEALHETRVEDDEEAAPIFADEACEMAADMGGLACGYCGDTILNYDVPEHDCNFSGAVFASLGIRYQCCTVPGCVYVATLEDADFGRGF